MYNALGFIFNNNEAEADEIIKSYGYKKIGYKKENPIGFCISFNDKKYWPISNALNPLIDKTDDLQILREKLELEF